MPPCHRGSRIARIPWGQLERRAFGRMGLWDAYSCQTYKHVNAGEGGLLVTDDPDGGSAGDHAVGVL